MWEILRCNMNDDNLWVSLPFWGVGRQRILDPLFPSAVVWGLCATDDLCIRAKQKANDILKWLQLQFAGTWFKKIIREGKLLGLWTSLNVHEAHTQRNRKIPSMGPAFLWSPLHHRILKMWPLFWPFKQIVMPFWSKPGFFSRTLSIVLGILDSAVCFCFRFCFISKVFEFQIFQK